MENLLCVLALVAAISGWILSCENDVEHHMRHCKELCIEVESFKIKDGNPICKCARKKK